MNAVLHQLRREADTMSCASLQCLVLVCTSFAEKLNDLRMAVLRTLVCTSFAEKLIR